ncbi:MAG TPA: 2-amino-4-hydroxy-6-hydroxymethyldihydropteridine diphosphokinase [Galbitalea sp.]|jgi:2-amino-4-hydroxy-6-hydroxymethyldihydropteridine diphosphokinase
MSDAVTAAGVKAVLSLGSNLGPREQTIRDAIDEIAALVHVSVDAVSGLVETPALKPDGIDESAPAYLNAVAQITTTLSPEQLLVQLNGIEAAHGRVRETPWGDRTLDIDIVTMDGLTMATDILILPHPRAHERSFVLVPWLEIDPDAALPGLGRVDRLLPAHADVRRYPAEGL